MISSTVRRGTILFTREVRWSSTLPVSTRMLAERFLADGWRVIWLNPVAPSPVPRLDVIDHGALLELRPGSPVPTSFRSAVAIEARHTAAWLSVGLQIRRALRQRAIPSPSVLWLSHIKSVGVQRIFPGVRTIWHVTDDYAGMSRFPGAAARLCRVGFRSAERVACVSSELRDAVVRTYDVPAARCVVLPHGVDADRLRGRSGPDPFPGVTSPRLVYVGNTRRMDVRAVDALAQTSGIHLVIIGEREPLGSLLERENVTAVGPLPPDQVGALLPWCDAGLISYSPRDLVNAQLGNPMKAMEYAAAGLPILSPPLPAYRDLDLPVRLYSDLDGLRALVAALPPSAAEREELRERVRAHTWQARYEQALTLVAGWAP